MSVYKENGGYTEQAASLSNEVSELLTPTVCEYMDNGMSIEEIVYVTLTTLNTMTLKHQIGKRIAAQKEKAVVKSDKN